MRWIFHCITLYTSGPLHTFHGIGIKSKALVTSRAYRPPCDEVCLINRERPCEMFSNRICFLHTQGTHSRFLLARSVHMFAAHVYIALLQPALPVQAERELGASGRVALPVTSRISPRELLAAWRLTRPTCLPTYPPNDQRAAISVAVMSVRGKQVQNGTYEFDYMRVPDTRTRWEILRDGIYNSQEGTYCGHPPKKWGESSRTYISRSYVVEHLRAASWYFGTGIATANAEKRGIPCPEIPFFPLKLCCGCWKKKTKRDNRFEILVLIW